MPEQNLRQLRVKKLLAQDPEINDTQLKELRMQLDRSIELLEQKSQRARRHILIALAVYLAGIVIGWCFAVVWRDAAPSAEAAIVRGLVFLPVVIAALAAAPAGIWLVALYVFKYAPQLNRARFDVQTAMMLELQQQVRQLQENMERRDK